LLKDILSYCGYSPTSPFFLLRSEHKHCDNAATNLNSKDARSRLVASLRGSMGTGTKKDGSSTGRVWAAGFHNFTACSCLSYEPFISLIFQIFGGPWWTADTESLVMGVCLYLWCLQVAWLWCKFYAHLTYDQRIL